MSSHAFLRDPGNLAINQREVTSLFSALRVTCFDMEVTRQRLDLGLRILRSGPGRDEPRSHPWGQGQTPVAAGHQLRRAPRNAAGRPVPVPVPVTLGPLPCPPAV